MRLHIEHTTVYTYERPVTFGRHRLVRLDIQLQIRVGGALRQQKRIHVAARGDEIQIGATAGLCGLVPVGGKALLAVAAGLVPAIHVLSCGMEGEPGTRPGMTRRFCNSSAVIRVSP